MNPDDHKPNSQGHINAKQAVRSGKLSERMSTRRSRLSLLPHRAVGVKDVSIDQLFLSIPHVQKRAISNPSNRTLTSLLKDHTQTMSDDSKNSSSTELTHISSSPSFTEVSRIKPRKSSHLHRNHLSSVDQRRRASDSQICTRGLKERRHISRARALRPQASASDSELADDSCDSSSQLDSKLHASASKLDLDLHNHRRSVTKRVSESLSSDSRSSAIVARPPRSNSKALSLTASDKIQRRRASDSQLKKRIHAYNAAYGSKLNASLSALDLDVVKAPIIETEEKHRGQHIQKSALKSEIESPLLIIRISDGGLGIDDSGSVELTSRRILEIGESLGVSIGFSFGRGLEILRHDTADLQCVTKILQMEANKLYPRSCNKG